MVYLIKYLYSLFVYANEKYADPRVQHWPLLNSFIPMTIVLTIYLAFVLHYGPKWMENRQPYNLKYVMRFYNAIQVLFNLVLFIFGVPNSYGHKDFSFRCQPSDPTNTEPWMMRLLYVTYGYYLNKYFDLLDTVFIVLRKKYEQISFLHIYHHAGIVFGVHVYMTYAPGSHSTMLGVINLFVHVVMYSYYFLASFQSVKGTIWWKRYLTQLQLIQFGYLAVHFLQVVIHNTCKYPMLIAMTGFIQNLFMFAMFFDFYYKAYIKKSKPKTAIIMEPTADKSVDLLGEQITSKTASLDNEMKTNPKLKIQ